MTEAVEKEKSDLRYLVDNAYKQVGANSIKSLYLRLYSREMKYIEWAPYTTFYLFQNKHQIHWHQQSVKMLCALKKSKHSVS